MYIEITGITETEIDKIEELLGKKVRRFTNIYQETCRIEAETTLANVLTAEELDDFESRDDYSKILDEMAEDIHDNGDTVFSDLCILSDKRVKEYLNK